MQLYISRDGEQNGPYSLKDVNACLKDSTLQPTDLACQEGMDEWVPLNEIPGVILTGDESVPTQNTESHKETSNRTDEEQIKKEEKEGWTAKRIILLICGSSVAIWFLYSGFAVGWGFRTHFIYLLASQWQSLGD